MREASGAESWGATSTLEARQVGAVHTGEASGAESQVAKSTL